MRALSGAIITAAALIGLGLTAQGIGTRYTSHFSRNEEGIVTFDETGTTSLVRFRDLDNPIKVTLVVLLSCVAIGLVTTFIGLAYHHHRRHNEYLHSTRSTGPHVTV